MGGYSGGQWLGTVSRCCGGLFLGYSQGRAGIWDLEVLKHAKVCWTKAPNDWASLYCGLWWGGLNLGCDVASPCAGGGGAGGAALPTLTLRSSQSRSLALMRAAGRSTLHSAASRYGFPGAPLCPPGALGPPSPLRPPESRQLGAPQGPDPAVPPAWLREEVLSGQPPAPAHGHPLW